MTKQGWKAEKIAEVREQLLEWYARNRRDLPWRRDPSPYAVWVSEIMLQQTRVAAVAERYKAFLERFPTLVLLAQAPEQEVLALWSGLGYYRRALMLHKAAQLVADQHQGNLPVTTAELRLLPGIGAYTAAAIASIAHGERVAAVDGNVERVLCRLEGWEGGSRKGGGAVWRRKIENLASELVDPGCPGDFNQAMMELGAILCTPRNPQCPSCPLFAHCATRGEHKMPERPMMMSREVAYALSVRSGLGAGHAGHEVLLEQRSATQTVMPGMWELPLLKEISVPVEELRMTVRHAIMQVNYFVRIRTVIEDDIHALTVLCGERRWVDAGDAARMALTGLARKVLRRARLQPAAQLDATATRGGGDVL